MREPVSPDVPQVCPDIAEEGPRISLTSHPPPRDSFAYRWGFRPADHNVAGLFIGGPEGERCTLAFLVYFTFCRVSAATPENERRQYVRWKALQSGLDPDVYGFTPFHTERRVTNGGRYSRPVKPATSGRRRKAA